MSITGLGGIEGLRGTMATKEWYEQNKPEPAPFNADAAYAEIDQLNAELEGLMRSPGVNIDRIDAIQKRNDELLQGIYKQRQLEETANQAKHAEELKALNNDEATLAAEIDSLTVNYSANAGKIEELRAQLDQRVERREAIESGKAEPLQWNGPGG